VPPVFVQTPSEYAIPQPVGTSGFLYGTAAQTEALIANVPQPVSLAAPEVEPVPVGTLGPNRAETVLATAARTRIETVQRPVGLNSVYVEFLNVKWFPAGTAVEFAADRFTQVGEHRGFPVYREKGRADDTIYVSVLPGEPGLVVPYKSR